MIPKARMTLDMYRWQAGLKTRPPVRPKPPNLSEGNTDTRFGKVLDSAAAKKEPVPGKATQGATLADYRRQRLPDAVAVLFRNSTLHSSRLDGWGTQASGRVSDVNGKTENQSRLSVAEQHKPSPSPQPSDAAGKSTIESSITEAAGKYKLPRQLIHSVIRAESNFQADAVSPAGAQGLMQLMPATARELGVTDPFDVRQNIDGGARYLRQMLDRFGGDLKVALAAYNAGPGTVARYDGDVPYRETRDYVRRVLAGMDAAGQRSV